MFLIDMDLKVISPLMCGKSIKISSKELLEYDKKLKRHMKKTYKVQTQCSEISSNSYKGALRWWFRTLMGYSKELYSTESNLFGSKGNAALFKIMLAEKTVTKDVWIDRLKASHKFGEYNFSSGKGTYDGLAYFGFIIYNKSRKKREIQTREYFKYGSQLSLKIMTSNEDIFKKLVMINWALLQFGGIGYRSRRCFGNLEILANRGTDIGMNDFLNNLYKNIDEYKSRIYKNLEVIKNIIFTPSSLENKIANFSGAKLFLSEKGFGNWEDAINYAGYTMQKYRSLKEPDHSIYKIFPYELEMERPIFGLPIQFRFSKGPNIMVNQFDDNETETRFASPIIVSLTSINSKLHVQYLVLNFDYNLLKIKAYDKKDQTNVKILTLAKKNFLDFLNTEKIDGHKYLEIKISK